MTTLIKLISPATPQIVEDEWMKVSTLDDSCINQPRVIAPIDEWINHPEHLQERLNQSKANTETPVGQGNAGGIGIAIENTTEVHDFSELLINSDLITIPFPLFTDGRGFSTARILREELKFTGELRATGDLLLDQLFYLYRCGFNAFEIEGKCDLSTVEKMFKTFSVKYQSAADEPLPLFARI